MASVASVPRSIAFYEKLGFTVGNTFAPPDAAEPTWAWLDCGDVHLMIAANSEAVSHGRHTVLFYLYVDDVTAMHAELASLGLQVGAIATPFYAPGGEFEVSDPDGHVLMITHV
jgi:predicted enzyme related to lactoylglutathione lyase